MRTSQITAAQSFSSCSTICRGPSPRPPYCSRAKSTSGWARRTPCSKTRATAKTSRRKARVPRPETQSPSCCCPSPEPTHKTSAQAPFRKLLRRPSLMPREILFSELSVLITAVLEHSPLRYICFIAFANLFCHFVALSTLAIPICEPFFPGLTGYLQWFDMKSCVKSCISSWKQACRRKDSCSVTHASISIFEVAQSDVCTECWSRER